MIPTEALTDLHDYLLRTRWFAGKGRDFTVTGAEALAEVPGRLETSPYVVIELVEVTYADGESERYQVPLALYATPERRLDHAFVGYWEVAGHGLQHAYDALHDREAMACYLRSFAAVDRPASAAAVGRAASASERVETNRLTFLRVNDHELDLTTHSSLFAGEQSNSSVAYGEDSLLKVFRKLTPGVNPDIRIHEALTEAGSEHVAPLYGWLEASSSVVEPVETTQVLHLAMLQAFLRTATDGWDLGLASVRTLFAEPEQHASESGGDFAGEATRLGEALREVHATLATHFDTEQRGREAVTALADSMTERLARAVAAVPQLEAYAAGLQSTIDAVRSLDRLEVQTVHGDLHLGQTLRTSLGWKIVDFEGEPARPLADRLEPDSRWRDVAGMLRSFDYAPGAVIAGMEVSAEERTQLLARAAEWTHRATNHFLHAYAGELGVEERVLLDAYTADKAAYECVYEARNRPTWLDIPLTAVARLSGRASHR